jgi:hypothetical protein
MRINEVISEAAGRIPDWVDRFIELGIRDAADYFYNWIHHGEFKLTNDQMDRYEAAFYLTRSVLPDEVIRSYGRLPVMYRGMLFPPNKLNKLYNGGITIKSKIMSWTPNKKDALQYAFHGRGVILKHQPREQEVVLSMNKETMNFLHIPHKFFVANPGETILSLPILKITPDMVDQISNYGIS